MKKLAAAFAASAVAVSMLAFAGCDHTNNTDAGAIPGNYEEKTPEQITEIVNGIDTDKIFGDTEAADASVNMGVKVDLSGAFGLGDMLNANGAFKLDYKMSANQTSAAGQGSMSLNASYTSMMSGTEQKQSVNFAGSAYNDSEWVYAASGNDKLKINMEDLFDSIGNIGGGDISGTITPASFYEAEDAFNVAQMLAMAQQFGVKVAIDDSDGIKIKLSVTEETVWKIAAAAGAEGGITDEMLTQIKGLVTFNSFKFDIYFALDSEGAFSGASVVLDINVKADGNLLGLFMPGSPAPTAEATLPDITANIKGSVEIYTHNDTVTVPDSVSGDAAYVDMTETIINMIENMM